MVGDGGLAPVTPIDPAYKTGAAPAGKRPKKLLIGLAAGLVLIIGVVAWYFGYYMNPSTVYDQSLKNTGKGYDKLVDYVDAQDKLPQKGYTGSGSYKVKTGTFSTDGKVAVKGDSANGELTFDIGLGATRVNADIRTIKSSGDTPDIYVKASDIKGLGTIIGVPALDTSLAKIDNTWIVIDHTFIDNLNSIATAQAQADSSAMQGPTHAQLLDEARAFGKVNQQYLFSTDKNKAVTKVVKNYGKETVDGHKTYHYKVILQKDNVKKYIYAQRDALKASTLNDWLKKNKYDTYAYDSFNSAADSTKDIKSTDTYDVWMDISHRIIYKVRFSGKQNPASNYVDVGLDYKGGDTFPFFVNGNFKDSQSTDSFSFVTTLDTKSGDIGFKFNSQAGGSDGGTVAADFILKPATTAIKVSKPSGAIPLSQVLSELGYSDLLSQLQSSSSSYNTSAQDSKRQADIDTIQTQLEAFFQDHGYYPSLSDMNNGAWLSSNMKSLDQNALKDPTSTNKLLSAAPAEGIYSYEVTDDNGNSCENDDTQCTKYTLTATFSAPVNGQTTYSKNNLD